MPIDISKTPTSTLYLDDIKERLRREGDFESDAFVAETIHLALAALEARDARIAEYGKQVSNQMFVVQDLEATIAEQAARIKELEDQLLEYNTFHFKPEEQ